MPRLRRLGAASIGATLLSLPYAHEAIAIGGRGSSGFGRGGGGGGGGFGGGRGRGGGGFFFFPVGGGIFTLILIAVAIYLAFVVLRFLAARATHGSAAAKDHMWSLRSARKRRERVEAVRLAAAEAADDDAAFAPDVVEARAAELFKAVQLAWDRRDRAALRSLAGADLLREWDRRLDDFDRRRWHNRAAILEEPTVEYVGLVNREDDADDRVTVRISCRVEDYVETVGGRIILLDGHTTKEIRLAEYWTLSKGEDGQWRLLSIEQDREGAHQLEGEIVASPWGDDQRLHDNAVAERAAAEALPEGMSPADVAAVDFDGPARTAAQDVALADGRFDPALIEASVRRAVDGWVTAVDGPDGPLEAVARPEVVAALLHPGDEQRRQSRLVVRGLRLDQITISGVNAQAQPATISVEIAARGRRYVEDRDTAEVLAGSREREARFVEHWTLALEGDGEWPWRIAGVSAPATA